MRKNATEAELKAVKDIMGNIEKRVRNGRKSFQKIVDCRVVRILWIPHPTSPDLFLVSEALVVFRKNFPTVFNWI